MKIALDGPAASGKGTLGRLLAKEYELQYLDTGKIFRLIAYIAKNTGVGTEDIVGLQYIISGIDLSALENRILESEYVGSLAADYARVPIVRELAAKLQYEFIAQRQNVLLDGRDIGTIIMPDADVKLFVTASAAVRADRRYREILRLGGQADYEAILADIRRRDERDMGRADSPLRPAHDAHLLDTSEMSIEAAFRAARAIVDGVLAARNGA